MGGSLALALRAAGQQGEIIGIARRPENVHAALACNAIDRGSTNLADVADADVVILATPVRVILRHIVEVAPLLKPGALLIDLGSTKQAICAALAAVPEHVAVVGAHPMCGKESSGFDVADASLYHDKTFVLCPLPRTTEAALATALALVHAVGARPLRLDPAEHDELVAAVSHVPYLLSTALITATTAADGQAWQVAASGFRDTTRLAGSDPGMMLDIVLTNQAAIRTALDRVRACLDTWAGWLAGGDEADLRAAFMTAQQQRRDHLPPARSLLPATAGAHSMNTAPVAAPQGDMP
jgi:prephenate dehydrogenase